ncbi:MAG: alanine dehydrogenase [Candidatus Melainabacteria bacterium]|nr:alanine dehydrogenase [Candidatus Melainabacteria bacterium]
MKIGVPKEILDQEYRVALTPAGVYALVSQGHKVFVEHNAGLGSSINDDDYVNAGANILKSPEEIFNVAELILKVKQPLEHECKLLKPSQILFTFLHLAADKKLAVDLCKSKATCIAYETIELPNKSLPLLIPMSEIAGRMSVQIGAHHLEKYFSGKGILLGGVPGVEPATVVIIGGGTVGINAAKMAVGLGAKVAILDNNLNRLRELDDYFGGRLQTVYSTQHKITELVQKSDLVITAVLVTGAKAPKLITKEIISKMKAGTVIVDVAVDQGGCVEGSIPTKHSDPVIKIQNIIVYSVPNIPGAVSITSTSALTNATLPYVLKLANSGFKAIETDSSLEKGVNVYKGSVVHKAVAEALDMEYASVNN